MPRKSRLICGRSQANETLDEFRYAHDRTDETLGEFRYLDQRTELYAAVFKNSLKRSAREGLCSFATALASI